MDPATDSPRPAEAIVLPARGWRIDPRRAGIAALICWIGFAAVVFAVQTGRSSGIDAAGLLFWRGGTDLHARGPGWLLEGVRDLTALGGVLLRHLFALGAIAALLFLRLRREALVLAGTIIGGWVLDSLAKHVVGRARPTIVPHLTEAAGTSFPSGHAFNSAVVYIAIALAFAAMSPRQSVRITLIASAIALTLLIGLSRVWLGVHWPSDVAAGWLGGAGWAFAASALLHKPAKAAAEKAAASLEAATPGTVTRA
ncbi:phosphatase PAP2 family protein [Parablastomonas sp. CN1-191]|uniref:phosphatase PAP2 family protein n=1 Tax=Parablastomonas sp. CN1-191 TaxID=3400908 RepID=UPI003BF91BBE